MMKRQERNESENVVNMIEEYTFGQMMINGKRFTKDLKIIRGKVVPNWWRKNGHILEIDDINDVVEGKPDILIIGTGDSGLMQPSAHFRENIADMGIKMIAEKTMAAVEQFNLLAGKDRNIAAAFHLTC